MRHSRAIDLRLEILAHLEEAMRSATLIPDWEKIAFLIELVRLEVEEKLPETEWRAANRH